MRTFITNKELEKELLKYSKEELIEIIFIIRPYIFTYEWNSYKERLKRIMKEKKQNNLYELYQKAQDKLIIALDKQLEYERELMNKYGVNGTLYFKDVPKEEVNTLLLLHKEFKNAQLEKEEIEIKYNEFKKQFIKKRNDYE